MRQKVKTLSEAAALVPNGALVGLMRSKVDGSPMAFVRELIRQRKQGLRAASRGSGLAVDMLIGAGVCVELESCSMDLDKYGPAPHFQRALRSDGFTMKDNA